MCNDGVSSVPYSLVCDYRSDCPGEDDERFCEFPHCPEFQCFSGQCIGSEQVCNGKVDCRDGGEEHNCARVRER